HGLAQGEPRGRAARALADPVLERDDEGGAVVALLQPRGDDADDAGVPALAGGEDEGAGAGIALDLGDRRLEDARLDLAPLGVEGVELAGEARRLRGVVGREQRRAEAGLADAAAGVDAG